MREKRSYQLVKIKKSKDLNILTMTVFVIMNFVLTLSGTLFNGILDKIAIDMNISVAQTSYLTSLYAYGAVGAPSYSGFT